MAYEERLEVVTLEAGVNLSDWNTYKFTVVKLDGNGRVIPVAAVGDNPIGILQNDPRAEQAARIAVGGISKARAGGTIAVGAKVASSNGRLITAGAGSRPIGTALEAGVNNQIISVALDGVTNAPVQV